MASNPLAEAILALEGPIAVFGGAGFIGANLATALARRRADCFAVTHSHFVPWRLVDLPLDQVVYADLTRPETVAALFERHRFRTIFNLAAYGGYAKQSEVDLIHATNLMGTVHLTEIAARHGYAAFVQAGSSSEYGLNSAGSAEQDHLEPNSHYSVSKISAAYLVRYLGKRRNLPIVHLRYYSVYGPYEEPDRLVPRLLEQAALGRLPPLVDPDISRDFVFVDDAVEATVQAALAGVHRAPGEAINIASGAKTTVRELVEVVRELCGVEATPTWGSMPNRSWDRKDWFGNPSFAREVLGWQAQTPLRDGLARTRDWQKARRPSPASAQPTPLARPLCISAVVACYQDAQAIPIMYERLTRVFQDLQVEYEIIFVNDASPDHTDAVLAELTHHDPRVVAIEHSRNFGSQSAFLSGMQIASGDAVVLLDGDLQDPPEVIPELFLKWREGFEVVYGQRAKRQAPRLLNLSYKLFYRLFRGVAYVPIPLDAGDFSLLDRRVVDELLALPETDQYLRGLRAWVGFRQTGVSYFRPERMFGKSTNNWRRNIGWAKKAIFSFSYAPLEILSYGGVLLTAVSLLALVAQVVARLVWPGTPQGLTTIIVLILFFGGVQMLSLSVLGEYLIRIFEESKKRPKFVRRAIRQGGRRYESPEALAEFLARRGRK